MGEHVRMAAIGALWLMVTHPGVCWANVPQEFLEAGWRNRPEPLQSPLDGVQLMTDEAQARAEYRRPGGRRGLPPHRALIRHPSQSRSSSMWHHCSVHIRSFGAAIYRNVSGRCVNGSTTVTPWSR